MEKLLEKRNFGVPVTLLTFLSYLIGYSLTVTFNSLVVAILFAFIVFSFQFDDKVKSAVKQSYIICFIANLVYLGFEILNQFTELMTRPDYDYNFIQASFHNIYRYGLALIHMAVIVIYLLFLIFALLRKDMTMGFVSSILGEGQKAKPVYQQPMPQAHNQPQSVHPQQQPQAVHPQQPQQPMYTQSVPQPIPQPIPQQGYQQSNQAPMSAYQNPSQQPVQMQQQPIPPAQQPAPGAKCMKCGTVNPSGALYCASCGARI